MCSHRTWSTDGNNQYGPWNENYPISNIEEFLIAFKADNTYAKTYTVEFSADGQNFQEMINVKDAKYKDVMENKIDPQHIITIQ